MIDPRDQAKEMLEKLLKEAKSCKKSEIPDVIAEFGSSFEDLVSSAMTGPATKITARASVTQNRHTTELPEIQEEFGQCTPNMVKVGINMGFTRNLGNYDSARFDVSIETFARDTPEDIEEGVARAQTYAEKHLIARQQELSDYLKKAEPKATD